jgi:Flp pilus assembly protein TadG
MRRRGTAVIGAGRQKGAELVEFALVLPILLMLVVGVMDFGAAFTLRAKMTNAARDAARIMASSPLSDLSCTSSTPCSVVAAATAAVNYMTNAGVNLSCISPGTPTTSGTLQWTYSCANGTLLVINRGYTYTDSSGSLIQATQVTLAYPVQLKLARLLPGVASTSTISTQVTMPNL